MKDQYIMQIITDRRIIPEGTFDVTSGMIDKFYEMYSENFPQKSGRMTNSNIKFAKKLAGLSLMKLNIARSAEKFDKYEKIKIDKPKCGIIYLVSNPAFPDMFKIGITQDLEKRLAQYQTGDPFRRYKVEHYKFVEDIRKEEERYLQQMSTDLAKGEWVKSEKVKELFV